MGASPSACPTRRVPNGTGTWALHGRRANRHDVATQQLLNGAITSQSDGTVGNAGTTGRRSARRNRSPRPRSISTSRQRKAQRRQSTWPLCFAFLRSDGRCLSSSRPCAPPLPPLMLNLRSNGRRRACGPTRARIAQVDRPFARRVQVRSEAASPASMLISPPRRAR